MAWVRIVPEDEAGGPLKEAYARIRARRGKVAEVVAVSGAMPEVMERGIDYYVALMFGPHKLPRAQREMLAVEVSRANACDYCVSHHGAALGRVIKDPAAAASFMADGSGIALTPKDNAMLAYARKLTRAPAEMGPGDVEALREAGFAAEEIVTVNHVVAYFNMMNRIVLGLGVELEPDKGADAAYKY